MHRPVHRKQAGRKVSGKHTPRGARPRVFVIHWNKAELAGKVKAIRSLGFQVSAEHENGDRACRAIIRRPPATIVIYLERLPSHGIRVAKHLHEQQSTQYLPVIFLDGEETPKAALIHSRFPNATVTTEEKLPAILKSIHSNHSIYSLLHKELALWQ